MRTWNGLQSMLSLFEDSEIARSILLSSTRAISISLCSTVGSTCQYVFSRQRNSGPMLSQRNSHNSRMDDTIERLNLWKIIRSNSEKVFICNGFPCPERNSLRPVHILFLKMSPCHHTQIPPGLQQRCSVQQQLYLRSQN